jgi:hypothetical protein
MARKHEAVKLLREGLSPSAIARTLETSVKTVLGYLYNQIGEGRIHRSDILFSIRPELRAEIEACLSLPVTWFGSERPSAGMPEPAHSWKAVKAHLRRGIPASRSGEWLRASCGASVLEDAKVYSKA